MVRIFFALALFATLLLIANAVLGFSIGGYNDCWQRWLAAQQTLLGQEQRSNSSQEDLQSARHRFQQADERFHRAKQRKTAHFLLGVVASLVTLLVNSITVTYFVGTSRWCREVVDTYKLDLALAERSAALKRKSFPWAVGGIMAILAVVILGSMADPAANAESSADWVAPHYVGAILGTGVVGWAFWVQVGNIRANFETISEIVDEVRRVRAERGLDDTSPETERR